MAKIANWTVAAILIVLGIAAIRWSELFGSTEGAASLAGALFGAAAVFVGAEISRIDKRANEKRELEARQHRLRTALTAELVGICVNHMESAKLFRSAVQAIANGTHVGTIDLDRYMPPEAPIYRALLNEITALAEKEIDALTTFYSGVAVTQRTIRELQRAGGPLTLFNAENLAGSFEHGCAVGATLFSRLAPDRKIQMPGAEPILMSSALQQAAGNHPTNFRGPSRPPASARF